MLLVQHPGRLPEHDRSRPWATLHAYLDGGPASAARFTESLRRANSRSGARLADVVARVPVAPLGPTPTAFDVTIADVAADGTFPAAGFPERVDAWAAATVAAWRR